MNYASSTSARRSSEIEQDEQEAEYVRLLHEEEIERLEKAYRRAVTRFLRADDRWLEALAAAIAAPDHASIEDVIGSVYAKRQRAIELVEAERINLSQVCDRLRRL